MSGRRTDAIEPTTLRQLYVGRSQPSGAAVILSIDEPNGRGTLTFVFSPHTANALARMLSKKAAT